jgi:hypothetical protein
MKKNYFLLSLTLLVSALFSVSSSAQIIANGTYKIFSSVHNEVMTVATTSPYDANMAVPNASDNYQLWTFTHQGGDVYKIVNVGNTRNLGLKDNWCGNFGDVTANFTSTDTNTLLKIAATPTAGKYTIEIAFTACNFGSVNAPVKAFDIQDGNAGAQIQTYEVNSTNANQQFSIVTPESLGTNSFSEEKFKVFVDNDKFLNINSADSSNEIKIAIYDINGKLVSNFANSVSNNSVKMNLSHLSKGIYMVQLSGTDASKSTHKIIIY